MGRILIILEDNGFRQLASSWLKDEGHEIGNGVDLNEGLRLLDSFRPDVVILNISPSVTGPGECSMDEFIRVCISSPARRLIITGADLHFLGKEMIEKAVDLGAFAAFEKPLIVNGAFTGEGKLRNKVIATVNDAINSIEDFLSPNTNFKRDSIIGHSPAIMSCLAELEKAVASKQPILLRGETGTGKELFAKGAHENNPRLKGTFVPVNCASIPNELIESELFGYKRGGHFQAYRDKDGFVKQADRGTLFLDEIGELSAQAQASLLRCLEEKTFRPLGGVKDEHSEFRLVSATNQDLEDKIAKGEFRKDFYNRINTFTILLPPLRDRKEDIRDIALHFLKKACEDEGMKPKECSQEFMEALEGHDWQDSGKENVRGLRSVIFAAVSKARDIDTMAIYHLPSNIRKAWIKAGGGLTVHEPSGEEVMQWWNESPGHSGRGTEGVRPENSSDDDMDYDDEVSPPRIETLSDERDFADLVKKTGPAPKIIPENIVSGRIKWKQILKLTKEEQISLMVAAESLWKKKIRKPRKELAVVMEVSDGPKKCKDALDQFFLQARNKFKDGEITIENLKTHVSAEHRPALEAFIRKALSKEERKTS